jgi:hypothetical protein
MVQINREKATITSNPYLSVLIRRDSRNLSEYIYKIDVEIKMQLLLENMKSRLIQYLRKKKKFIKIFQ